ncbi:MAG: thiosulfate oxidation carrier protein SoxY [Betaproteobacteria bacterium]|nr:thiosulfate oxidation carrier protein SoxY [Betaproteobacteria bacterium]
MDVVRRVLLKGASATGVAAAALAAGLLRPQRVLAAQWDQNAFRAKSAADALKQLGAESAAQSKEVVLEAPQIAENGAVVPIEVSSNVPGTKSIAIVIDKNPFPLSAKFDFEEGALPYVKVNVKMGQTSEVRAIAEANGKYYVATREVKVTIGGCGG